MKRHLTKSVYILACSAGAFFGCANVFLAKAPCRNSRREEEMGRVKGSGEGAEREWRENHICSIQTWTEQLTPLEHNLLVRKKCIGTSSILPWGKSGVGFSTASKSCPDASVEIALTFLLRNTRDIPSRSNSKRLASTAGVKIRIYVRHFWIQNNSFPQFRANENIIINIDLQLIGRNQSTSPMLHQSGAPFAIVRSFPKEQWYRAGVFFFSPPPPLFPSFALASP